LKNMIPLTLPAEIQNIAGRYKQVKQPHSSRRSEPEQEKAQRLYQYVADTWPKSNNTINSCRETAYLLLDSNDVESAKNGVSLSIFFNLFLTRQIIVFLN
jgi:hypothetical protein